MLYSGETSNHKPCYKVSSVKHIYLLYMLVAKLEIRSINIGSTKKVKKNIRRLKFPYVVENLEQLT